MKKIVVLLFLFVLTGCTVKYNIEFVDDTVFENFTVNVNDIKEPDSINYLTNNDFYAYINPDMIKFNKEIEKGNNITKFKYSYKYNIDDYKDSMALSSCFKGYNIIKENNYYLFSTSKGIKCMTSDNSTIIQKLDITIKSNHKLIDTNADEVYEGKYVWHLNKKNYLEKSIMLKVYQNKYILNYNKQFTKKLTIFLIVLAIIAVSFAAIMIKRKRSNKI